MRRELVKRPSLSRRRSSSGGGGFSLLGMVLVIGAIGVGCEGTASASELAPVSASCTTDQDCAAKGYQDAYGVTPEKTREYSDRYYLADDDAVDPIAQCLLRLGYRGIAGDGDSVIYASTEAIEGCSPEPVREV